MDAETVQKIFNIGAAQVPMQLATGMLPFMVVPDDFKVETLEHLQEFPSRIKALPEVFNPDSFLHYWKLYKGDSSVLFADVQRPALTAYLDYHDPAHTEEGQLQHQARWSSHRLSYKFRPTKEWQIWSGSDGKAMKQVDFAQFIENNLADIVEPAAADIFEMVKNFEAKKSVNFSSGVRLDNGQVQFKYEETISTGAAQQGNFTVPETFTLAIAPYEGSENYKVIARFRYRIGPDGLSLRYELARPHKILEDAVYTLIGKIQDGVGQPILYGTLAGL